MSGTFGRNICRSVIIYLHETLAGLMISCVFIGFYEKAWSAFLLISRWTKLFDRMKDWSKIRIVILGMIFKKCANQLFAFVFLRLPFWEDYRISSVLPPSRHPPTFRWLRLCAGRVVPPVWIPSKRTILRSFLSLFVWGFQPQKGCVF